MYDFENEEITTNGQTEKILKYEVWFQVPALGMFEDLDEAKKACNRIDVDPQFAVVPVPVAVSENHYEIILR